VSATVPEPPVGADRLVTAPTAEVPDGPSSPDAGGSAARGTERGFEERIERMLSQLGARVGDALGAPGRLRGLAEAVACLDGEPDLPATLRRAAESACRLADARYGAIGVLGPDGELRDLVHVGVDAATAARIGALSRGRGLLGRVLRDAWALRVDDVAGHPEAAGMPPGRPTFEAFLGVPISVRGEAFGGIYLGAKHGGGPFTPQDEDLVTALAGAVGLAIGNAQLRDAARRQEAWHAASGEITAALVALREPWTALDLVASRARQVTSARLSAIVLPDPADGLIVTNAAGPGAGELRGRGLPMERGPLVEAMRAGRARLVTAAQLADLFGAVPDGLSVGCVMVVPMVAAGRAVGGLLLGAPAAPGPAAAGPGDGGGGTPFSAFDLRMATAFAGQAALTLELNRLQRDRERLAVFEDRDRIARDLHDVVIQRLFATGLQLQGMTRSMAEPVAKRVEDIITELDQTITELRHTIFSLSSPTPDGAVGPPPPDLPRR
jgi:GAF domain-containing protein